MSMGAGVGDWEKAEQVAEAVSALLRTLDFSLNEIRNLLKSFDQGGWDDQLCFKDFSVSFPVNLPSPWFL